jgi:hypothetical protein
MAVRKCRVPINMTITVRLDDDLLHKIDEMAMTLNRSRTDMVRQILTHSQLTGLPDVAASIPMVRRPYPPMTGVIRDLQAAGAGDGD